jgi:glycosyltransferase involved in cell wall biosynthesis
MLSSQQPPTLAVLITYYNEKELLRECLASLICQPEPPEVIIIYDDASQHPPEPYIPEGCEAQVIRGKTNKGPGYGRNLLLASSKSDYVHFHDSDDLFEHSWCARVREAITETSADVVFTEVSSFRGSEIISPQVLGLDRLVSSRDLVSFCIGGALLVPSGTYRRTVVEQVGGYRAGLWQSEDYDFHIRLAMRQPCYKVIPEPLVRIRDRPTSRSKKQAEVYTSALQAIRSLAEELPRRYRPDLAGAAARVGSKLYSLGARPEAREGFRLARELGPPDFGDRMFVYRIVARVLGQEVGEWAGKLYRALLPAYWRARLRSVQGD